MTLIANRDLHAGSADGPIPQGAPDDPDEIVFEMVRAWLSAVGKAGDEAEAFASASATRQAGAAAELGGQAERALPRGLLITELDELARLAGTGRPLGAFQEIVDAPVVASIRYVLMNSRGGLWLRSVLAARPLWKQSDPLDVLLAGESEREDDQDGRSGGRGVVAVAGRGRSGRGGWGKG